MKFSLLILILIIIFLQVMARADNFSVGGAGTYTQISLPSSTSADISTYRGPGYLLDARLRIYPPSLRKSFSFDIFLDIGQYFTKNIGANDTQQQDSTVGGLDFSFNNIFIGAQYGRAHSTIHLNSGSTVNLNYDIIGPRAGFKFFGGESFGMSLTFLYQTGTATPGGDNNIQNSQKINQMSALLLFHIKLMGDRFSY